MSGTAMIEPDGPYDLRVSLNELDARDTYATYHADKDKGVIRQYLPAQRAETIADAKAETGRRDRTDPEGECRIMTFMSKNFCKPYMAMQGVEIVKNKTDTAKPGKPKNTAKPISDIIEVG